MEVVFFCEAALKSNLISETGAIINSSQQIIGKILPGEEETTLSSFWNNPSATNRKLSFRPLTLFYNQNDPTKTQKIRGIPWRLTVSDTNTQIPTPTFTIETTASVNNGKFAKTQTVTLKEKTSISALDSFVAE